MVNNTMEKTEKAANAELILNKTNDDSIESLKEWYRTMTKLGEEVFRINVDYGFIQGMDKPALLKPGAEKIKRLFKLRVESVDCVREIFDTDKNYIDYTYKCIITSENGVRLGICDGNANSREDKFRYIFVPAAKVPAKKELDLLKLEGKGRWKKISDKWIWMERVENPDVLSLKNSIQKFAQKRAFVGAILMAAGASEFFSQEISSN